MVIHIQTSQKTSAFCLLKHLGGSYHGTKAEFQERLLNISTLERSFFLELGRAEALETVLLIRKYQNDHMARVCA